MASRNFNDKEAIEKEVKDLFLSTTYTALTKAQGTLNGTVPATNNIILRKVVTGTSKNGSTLTVNVSAAAANPTDTVLFDVTGTAAATILTITPNDGTNNITTPEVKATATLEGSVPANNSITLEKVVAGAAKNGHTFTIQVAAAAANPTDTVLFDVTGTEAATVITVTPNDGTNNTATPVTVTWADLAELLDTGSITGKNATLTDTGSLLANVTVSASTTDTTVLADAGEGDGEGATFAGGVDQVNTPVTVTFADLAEYLTSGSITDKTVTLTDTGSLLDDQTVVDSDSDTTVLVHEGEGDGMIATFAGATDQAFSSFINNGIESISEVSAGLYRITLQDTYASLKHFEVRLINSQDLVKQIKLETVASTKLVEFFLLNGATPTVPSTGTKFLIRISVKNTGVF